MAPRFEVWLALLVSVGALGLGCAVAAPDTVDELDGSDGQALTRSELLQELIDDSEGEVLANVTDAIAEEYRDDFELYGIRIGAEIEPRDPSGEDRRQTSFLVTVLGRLVCTDLHVTFGSGLRLTVSERGRVALLGSDRDQWVFLETTARAESWGRKVPSFLSRGARAGRERSWPLTRIEPSALGDVRGDSELPPHPDRVLLETTSTLVAPESCHESELVSHFVR